MASGLMSWPCVCCLCMLVFLFVCMSVCVCLLWLFFKYRFFWNYPSDFNKTSHKWFWYAFEELTLYQTITTFNNFWGKHLLKSLWEKEKMLVPFSTMFSTLFKMKLMFWVTFYLSSASTLNLNWAEILSFCKELVSRLHAVNLFFRLN